MRALWAHDYDFESIDTLLRSFVQVGKSKENATRTTA